MWEADARRRLAGRGNEALGSGFSGDDAKTGTGELGANGFVKNDIRQSVRCPSNLSRPER